MFFMNRIRRYYYNRARNIFRYWDGSAWRYADPVVAGTKLEETEPEYQTLLLSLSRKAESMPPGPVRDGFRKEQRDAAAKLASVSRKMFDLKPLDNNGGGVSDGEAVNVIATYFLFMEELATAASLFRSG